MTDMSFANDSAVAADTYTSDDFYTPAVKTTRPAYRNESTVRDIRDYNIEVDDSRNVLLTDFGKETLDDRYLIPGESYQDAFARVSVAYSDDKPHAERLYRYISNLWFMPATPVLSNGGTGRGLPISCYLNTFEDSLEGIVKSWTENVWLASRGGGIGSYWGGVRGIGEDVGLNGRTSGIIPFIHVMDSLTLAVAQGSLRRGSAAVYIDIDHPEIEEFLEIRKPSGDFNRKSLNIHHGVMVTDEFMRAVGSGSTYNLISPKDGSIRGTLDARSVFQKLVETRLATGEPYIVFSDTVNNAMPEFQKKAGLKVKTSNLCVAPETRILTKDGYKVISEVAGTQQNVWNGKAWSAAQVEKTGVKQKLVTVTLSNGVEMEVTPYHKWVIEKDGKTSQVATEDLKEGDTLTAPNFTGPGVKFSAKKVFIHKDGFDQVPLGEDVYTQMGWLIGFFNLQGQIVKHGDDAILHITSESKDYLQDIRLLLNVLGADAAIAPITPTVYMLTVDVTGTKALDALNLPVIYPNRAVSDAPFEDIPLVSIVSVEDKGRLDDTYCFNEPTEHQGVFEGILTGNCSEITLPTGIDHHGHDRTAVCCLSSLNLEKWEEWKDDPQFIEDVMRFLDNVLTDYIERAEDSMVRAKYSALRERSVGLGVMGFHSFLQKNNISFESVMAKSWNLKFFKHISAQAEAASVLLAEERGACPDAAEYSVMQRFACKMAIAPTASISIICGGTSACIEPIPANIYTHKTLSGSFVVKNPYLEELLESLDKNNSHTWNSILEYEGSVQHLDFLTDQEKATYKTSFEIDQRWIVDMASDRASYIDQAQSINLYIPADIDKWDLLMLHFSAWEKGVKSLYYLRSKSMQRAGFAGSVSDDNTIEHPVALLAPTSTDFDVCLSCQ